jgi:dipeptidase E
MQEGTRDTPARDVARGLVRTYRSYFSRMKIVAIGGGDMSAGETLAIDEAVVRLTGKSTPRALFLPTASFDADGYYESFQRIYGQNLGCETDVLYLWKGYSQDEIESKIQETKWNVQPHTWEYRGDPSHVQRAIGLADLVYVGGGNTRRMVELWRSIGVDRMLREAAERGAVLSGLSAGCICWARYGNTDAALTERLGKPTMRMDCLDFLPISLCPHMSREGFRVEEFKAMMRETPGVGIGLDDGCALEYVDGKYRFIACVAGAGAHRITCSTHEILEPSSEFRDFEELL